MAVNNVRVRVRLAVALRCQSNLHSFQTLPFISEHNKQMETLLIEFSVQVKALEMTGENLLPGRQTTGPYLL